MLQFQCGPSKFVDLTDAEWGRGYVTIFFFNDLTNFTSANNLYAKSIFYSTIKHNQGTKFNTLYFSYYDPNTNCKMFK